MQMVLRAVLVTVLTLALAAPVAAAPRAPEPGEYSFSWKRHQCVLAADSTYRSSGSIRTDVLQLPDPKKVYYQEVDIRIDKLVGLGTASATWSKVENKVYDWSRFTSPSLPTYSTSGVRTGLQPDKGQLSAKATVTLRQVRRGPDKKVWRYAVRSPVFTCVGGELDFGT